MSAKMQVISEIQAVMKVAVVKGMAGQMMIQGRQTTKWRGGGGGGGEGK